MVVCIPEAWKLLIISEPSCNDVSSTILASSIFLDPKANNLNSFIFMENAPPLRKEFSSIEEYGFIPTAFLFKLIIFDDFPIAKPDQKVSP